MAYFRIGRIELEVVVHNLLRVPRVIIAVLENISYGVNSTPSDASDACSTRSFRVNVSGRETGDDYYWVVAEFSHSAVARGAQYAPQRLRRTSSSAAQEV